MRPKVLVIVGPTASGKTSLGIALAKHFNGEVVSADSRQVYRGLDIGTAKVTPAEMDGVPHHLIDVADPEDTYTVSEYVSDARAAIQGILERGRLPIVVGGTFFYIDALLGKTTLPDVPPNPGLRAELEEMDTASLYGLVRVKDPVYAEKIDRDNPRRLVRALEIIEALGHVPEIQGEVPYDTLTLGVQVPKELLHERLHDRILSRIEIGMIDEVRNLETLGLTYARIQELGIEYKYISQYLHGSISYDTMLEELETKSRQYAKRQMTWLKRNTDIVWVNPGDQEAITSLVNKFVR